MSELGELSFGVVTDSVPQSSPVHGAMETQGGTRLLVPLGLDASEYGGAAEFTTLCVAPDRVTLEAPAQRKPRLVRRRRGSNASVGLEDLFEAYLRWSLAETATLIGEMRRRQVVEVLDLWTADLCCGGSWAGEEPTLAGQDPWTLMMDLCDETGIGRDSYVELSSEDQLRISHLAVEEIRRAEPDLWTRVGPPNDLMEEDYERLDLACGAAYAKLATLYEKRGQPEIASEIAEGDPGTAEDEWDAMLERVKNQVELGPLAEMLVPSDSAHALMCLDASVMTIDELAEELSSWAREAQKALAGTAPGVETLKAILALWAEPEMAVGLDWRGALDTMLAERSISRAARFLALRSRQAKRGGVA